MVRYVGTSAGNERRRWLALAAATLLSFSPLADAMTAAGSLTFPNDGRLNPWAENAAVIDAAHGAAYFGTDNAIVRIDLQTFRRAGSIVLDASQAGAGVGAGILDSGHGFAYFGTVPTYQAPARILKVDLQRFALVDPPLPLPSGATAPGFGLIDADHGFAYFGSQQMIYQVNLATFQLQSFTFPAKTGEQFHCGVIDAAHGMLYLGASLNFAGEIIEVSVPSGANGFVRQGTIPLGNGEGAGQGVIDTNDGAAYFTKGDQGISDKVIQVRLSPFARGADVDLSAYQSYPETTTYDPIHKKIYLGDFTRGQPAQVLKVGVGPGGLTYEGKATVATDGEGFMSSVIDPDGGHLYLGTTNTPIQIHRLDLNTFSFVDHLTLSMRIQYLLSAFTDSANGYAYLLTRQDSIQRVPSTIVKVRLSDFSLAGELVLSNDDFVWCWVMDPNAGFLYLGTFDSSGRVIKVRMSDLAQVDSLAFSAGENQPIAAGVDLARHVAYFASTQGSKLVEIDIDPNHFARVGALTLAGSPTALAIDGSRQLGYAAVTGIGSGTTVLQIDLRTGQETKRSAPLADNISFSTLDDQSGAPYFIGSKIYQVKTTDLSFVPLAGTAYDSDAAIAMDDAHGLAYSSLHYGDASLAAGQVAAYRLSDLARLQTLSLFTDSSNLTDGNTYLQALTIDPAHDYGYAGTANSPSTIFRFTLDPPGSGNQAPSISSVAASPAMVSDATAALTVVATDDGGEPNLTYTWSAASTPAGGSVSFSANGTNAAKSVTATFTKSGPYRITVTATDKGTPIRNASASVDVTVAATPRSLSIAPVETTLAVNGTRAFVPTVVDQFGDVISPTPSLSWSATGGTISDAGVFTAGPQTGDFSVRASASGTSASAVVHIVDHAPPNQPPQITAGPFATVEGFTARFSVTAQDPEGGALTYLWDFGDGSRDTAPAPEHRYAAAATYRVGLVVTDDQNATATGSVRVTVAPSGENPSGRSSSGVLIRRGGTGCVTGDEDDELLDVKGRRIAHLVSDGHQVCWTPRGVASGLYFTRRGKRRFVYVE